MLSWLFLDRIKLPISHADGVTRRRRCQFWVTSSNASASERGKRFPGGLSWGMSEKLMFFLRSPFLSTSLSPRQCCPSSELIPTNGKGEGGHSHGHAHRLLDHFPQGTAVQTTHAPPPPPACMSPVGPSLRCHHHSHGAS
uniref:Uncharacterized protein n=1 Tax=Myotis myotis TaxID=51298 RepID=A0A7J7VIE6_MYOMY|nr:hypothetical protein mMyoMyo1_008381 [Myotis myotis]